MSDIDPVQFGALTAQVKTLEAQVNDLQSDVKTLLELANKSKGGFWAGMAIASAIGGVVSWVVSNFHVSIK
ncbi:hypothetical protein [uncultured Rhodoferax sp.]|uniref:hypothetical protein n=1 Tax=uncultured Rhodoferax sp. TaxID=223188 RepID=UPI0025E2D8D5|nr:hypothetical protein [uncultured Rhodoferax sp.]